jgi:hypothetical protein
VSTKKFKSEDIKEVTDSGEVEGLTLIEDGEWVSEGKYDYRESIIRDDNTGKFYNVGEGRSGSYFTDYYYDSEDWPEELELNEVAKVEVKKYEWVIVR